VLFGGGGFGGGGLMIGSSSSTPKIDDVQDARDSPIKKMTAYRESDFMMFEILVDKTAVFRAQAVDETATSWVVLPELVYIFRTHPNTNGCTQTHSAN
jgi:hypothetical protein